MRFAIENSRKNTFIAFAESKLSFQMDVTTSCASRADASLQDVYISFPMNKGEARAEGQGAGRDLGPFHPFKSRTPIPNS